MGRMLAVALVVFLCLAGWEEGLGNAAGVDERETTPCASAPAGEASTGTLGGTVMRGPTCPAQRPGEVCVAPAAGIKIAVMNPSGEPVAGAVSDNQGAYNLILPPGSYRITTGPLDGMEFTRDLPAEITIHAGQRTRFDIQIDTGIR